MNTVGTGLVYAGFLTGLAALVSLVRPLAFLGMPARGHALVALACGLILAAIGGLLPAPECRVAAPATRLDDFLPAWQFGEFHRVAVRAPRRRVYEAVEQVTAREILLFRTLTWIRRFGRPGPESILNAPEDQPLLEVAARTSFLRLAEDAGREIVLGSLVIVPSGWRPAPPFLPEPWKALAQPGFAKAAINFRIEDAGGGACLLTTETRVFATDAATRRRFAAYWRVIYPGSALIRKMWLRAIRLRAERSATIGAG